MWQTLFWLGLIGIGVAVATQRSGPPRPRQVRPISEANADYPAIKAIYLQQLAELGYPMEAETGDPLHDTLVIMNVQSQFLLSHPGSRERILAANPLAPGQTMREVDIISEIDRAYAERFGLAA